MTKLLIGAAALAVMLALAGFLSVCVMLTRFFVHPARPKPGRVQAALDAFAGVATLERHEFTTVDGHRITALWALHPASEGASLVLCHGATSYKEELLELARYVYESGVSIFLFDFRGHGEHPLNHCTIGTDEIHDAAGAVECLLTLPGVDPTKVGMVGHSMGAVAVVNYLAEYDIPIRYAILLAPFATLDRALYNRLSRMKLLPSRPARETMAALARREFGRDFFANAPLNVVGSIRETALCYIHGTADRGNNPQDSQDLFDQTMTAKELYWIEGCPHHEIIRHPGCWAVTRDYVARQLGRGADDRETPEWGQVVVGRERDSVGYVQPTQVAKRPT